LSIHEQGIEILEGFLPTSIIDSIIKEVSDALVDYHSHGIRNAEKKFETIKRLVESEQMIDKAEEILGSLPKIVRVIFFDKTPERNWLVTWHQDKTISVNGKKEIVGWGPWTKKDGVHCVQPDLNVLNSMVTFRVHLDDADERNGNIRVIPGSHLLGILSSSDILKIKDIEDSISLNVKSGDVIMMRPHLLHSSSKAVEPSHRRIVHVEYSNYELPKGMKWA
jgi:hypothetical protein